MQVRNVLLIGTPGLKDIRIKDGKILAISAAGAGENQKDELTLSFSQAIAFPGLINSHDHLDFNLYPRLGNKVYNNYLEWGRDIHAVNREEINRVLQIPRPLRVQWGIYKNLLNGITTVVNHGSILPVNDGLITVFQRVRSLHSPAFEKNWRWKINFSSPENLPVVIHLGEGTDKVSSREIDRVIKWNIFRRKLIAIHGVAMNSRQAAAFHGLIWCPASNYFLLDKTADLLALHGQVNMMFGTDSTLTASWNLWDHLRLARNQKMVPDMELLGMLTDIPAKTWGLDHCGGISEGCLADMVVAAGKNESGSMDNFYALNPEDLLLVLHRGNIRLFDATLLGQLEGAGFSTAAFSIVFVNERMKYVEGNLPGLMQRIREYYPVAEFPVHAA